MLSSREIFSTYEIGLPGVTWGFSSSWNKIQDVFLVAQQKQGAFVINGIGEAAFSLKSLSSKLFINMYATSVIVKNWQI